MAVGNGCTIEEWKLREVTIHTYALKQGMSCHNPRLKGRADRIEEIELVEKEEDSGLINCYLLCLDFLFVLEGYPTQREKSLPRHSGKNKMMMGGIRR